LAFTKTNIGNGLMVLGIVIGVGGILFSGHVFREPDIGYHAAMTYGMLIFGVGGIITESRTNMTLGSLSLLGSAFIIATYIIRLGAAGLL
jgi:hypothetical protein